MQSRQSQQHQNITEPLAEIRSYLSANQQMVRGLQESLRETAMDAEMSLNKIQSLDTNIAVILTRIERIEKDAEDVKESSSKQMLMIWGALLAAVFSVTVPYVIHPGSSQSVSSK
jgi:DNA repair exonuclease SbcCD ATPase subunit